MRRCLLVLAVVLAGCAGSDPCGDAARHVAECTGTTPAAPPDRCDPEAARSIAEARCADLAGGKADGADLVCSWFGVLCDGGRVASFDLDVSWANVPSPCTDCELRLYVEVPSQPASCAALSGPERFLESPLDTDGSELGAVRVRFLEAARAASCGIVSARQVLLDYSTRRVADAPLFDTASRRNMRAIDVRCDLAAGLCVDTAGPVTGGGPP